MERKIIVTDAELALIYHALGVYADHFRKFREGQAGLFKADIEKAEKMQSDIVGMIKEYKGVKE